MAIPALTIPLLALANGQSPSYHEMGQEAEVAMLTDVCQYLAKVIARDGEGATAQLRCKFLGDR